MIFRCFLRCLSFISYVEHINYAYNPLLLHLPPLVATLLTSVLPIAGANGEEAQPVLTWALTARFGSQAGASCSDGKNQQTKEPGHETEGCGFSTG